MVFFSSIISEDALNRLQKSLSNLTEFFAENQLNLNASKSEFITFCQKIDSKNVDTDTIVINGHYVAKKSECKFLGLILDSSLSFYAQMYRYNWTTTADIIIICLASLSCFITFRLFSNIFETN